MKYFFALLLSLIFVSPSYAATHYIRQGASGNGSDWTNAWGSFGSATFTRGDTYYVANGSYGAWQPNHAPSGTLMITIKKAIIADHGTATGWNDAYAGQASIAGIEFQNNYYTIDGQVRNESDWSDQASYGFQIGVIRSTTAFGLGQGSHLVLRYVDVGDSSQTNCTYVPSTVCSGKDDSIYFFGSPTITDITVSHFRSHHGILAMRLEGVDTALIEYGWMGPNWSKEAIRGGDGLPTTNATIRYNKFIDSCKGTPGDAGGEGCTGIIGFFQGGPFTNNAVYGNLFFDRASYPNDQAGGPNHTNGCIYFGDPGENITGSQIYNNTIVGMGGFDCSLILRGGSGNTIYNNLWYNDTATSKGCIAQLCANNTVVGSGSQFVNALSTYPATGWNYHLASATADGTHLSSPYNQDMDGNTRGAAGVWDLGAFEFGSSNPVPTSKTRGGIRGSGSVRSH